MKHFYSRAKFIKNIKWEQGLLLFVHVSVWLMLFVAIYLFSLSRNEKLPYFILLLYSYSFILFYLNYFLLTPRYLLQKKYLVFSVSILLIVLFSYLVADPIIHHYAIKDFAANPPHGFHNRLPFNSMSGMRPPEDKTGQIHQPQVMFFLLFSFLIISSLIRTFQKLNIEEDINRQYHHEKLNAELMMLRQQVNPHFLFNSLNNILSLANRKSDLTVEAIVKLSNILRHMLSEDPRKEIPVTREIDLIQNYIDLQKLWSKNTLKVDLLIEGMNDTYCIEPFILNPLVENAFKYGILPGIESTIAIHIKMVGDVIYFRANNSVVRDKLSKVASMGIGINNVIRRLELCYQENYKIDIAQIENNYLVNLSIKLKNNELHRN